MKSPDRHVEAPTETADSSAVGGTVFSHPAYAQISASRVTGSTVLYGSDFRHRGYVRIRISRSTLRRTLSSDWPHSDQLPYIEVDLSEAQWAHFVSSMNIGEGTQCTLRRHAGMTVPELPEPTDRQSQFSEESDERMRQAMDSLDQLASALAGSGLSSKRLSELQGFVRSACQNIGANREFVAEQFSEYMERTTESAKIEVNAYAMNALRHAGLESLASKRDQTLIDATPPTRISRGTAGQNPP